MADGDHFEFPAVAKIARVRPTAISVWLFYGSFGEH